MQIPAFHQALEPLDVSFSNVFCRTKLLNFHIMQVQLDVGFDQLVQIANRLPATQWTKLKKEVEASEQPKDTERKNSENS